MTRYLTNFTAQAIEDFATSPDDPKPELAKPTPAKEPDPAPVESQGEPPPLTMEQTQS